MSPHNRRIPDLMLERYLADAMDAKARRQVEALLAESPADAARLAELRANSEAFLQRHPPEGMLAHLRTLNLSAEQRVPLVGALTRRCLTEAQRPEASYISDEFVALCLASRLDPGHALQHPGFNSPGEAPISRFIVAVDDLLEKALAEHPRLALLKPLLLANTPRPPELSEQAVLHLATVLERQVEKHPDLPAEFKGPLTRILSRLR